LALLALHDAAHTARTIAPVSTINAGNVSIQAIASERTVPAQNPTTLSESGAEFGRAGEIRTRNPCTQTKRLHV